MARSRRHPLWLWTVVTALAAVAIVSRAPDAIGAEAKRILILHSFGRDFEPWSAHARKLKEELSQQSLWPLDIQEHELVGARSNDGNPEAVFVAYLRAVYAQAAPHLIVTIGAPAALFVQRHRPDLLPTVPLLLAAVDKRFVQQANLTANDAAVASVVDLPATFRNIQLLLPETNKVFALLGASPLERAWLTAARQELAFLDDLIDVVWLNDLPFEDMLRQVAEAPPRSAVFWGPVRVDSAGVSHPGSVGLERLSATSRAPIFSYHDTFFNGHTVGGPMISTALVEKRTANVAVRILNGEKPGTIQVDPVVDPVARYDWRQLQRWGISESRLPPGSEVLFREPGIWMRYQRQLLLLAAAIVAQSLLIAALIYQHHQRGLAEVQARQRMGELAHVNRQTVAGELTASISHELNQPLGAILANAEALELMLDARPLDLEELKQTTADIKRDEQRASEVLRRIRSLLKKTPFAPRIVDLGGIVRDTAVFLDPAMRRREVSLATSAPNALLQIRGDPVQLQQVIVNLVLNAADAVSAMDAERRQVAIGLAREADNAKLWVSDRGPGIPDDKLKEIFQPFVSSKAEGMGLGLSIARTIVEAHGGTISAENRADGGARFLIWLPLA